jgi:hypothetical protein
MTFLVKIAFVLLKGAIALFPARYRREYGEERTWVVQLALEEAAEEGLQSLLGFCAREIRDLPMALLREHSKEWGIQKELAGNREPGYTLWAGLFPFVLLGSMALLFEVPREWGNPDLLRALSGILMFGGYLVILAGLLVGALAGFPRWSFPYLGYGFIFALYISNASTPGLVVFNIEMWGRELWGWRAWVPLGIVLLLVLLLNRHPGKLLEKLWNEIAKNWSSLTFGFYGLLPLVVLINLDEMENTYSFPGAAAGVLLITVGAFLYLRLKSPSWRTFSLVAFAFLGILVVNMTAHLYWETHSVNFDTNERRLLEGPVPYASILAKALKDSIGAVLFLLLPAIGKILGLIQQLGQSITRHFSNSG